MTPEIQVLPAPAAVAAAAAQRFAEAARASTARRGRFHVALAGGTTPRQAYADIAARTDIDWSKCEIYWGDERCVPPGDAASNYRAARAALLDAVAIPPHSVHRMRGEAADAEAAAHDYAALLASRLGTPPVLDLVLLGLGDDGHTASLFPQSPALGVTRLFVATAVSPQRQRRLTLTFPAINAAREVLFLVTGAGKRAALERALAPSGDVLETPARGVQPRSGRVVWLVDAAAWGAPPPTA